MSTQALTVIDNPRDLALFQHGYVEQYQREVNNLSAELEEAQQAMSLADDMSLATQKSRWGVKVKTLQEQLEKAKTRLSFYSNSFLPLPRMQTADLKWAQTQIPLAALRRLKEAKELGVFDDFGIVEAQINRDPILIGIKRFPDGEEVQCFIAWWR